jgi:diguanylate cyclase (GGDEF)-like protein
MEAGFKYTNKHTRELSIILELSKFATSVYDLDKATKIILNSIAREFNTELCLMYLYDEEAKKLKLVASQGLDSSNIDTMTNDFLKIEEDIVQKAIQTNKVQIMSNLIGQGQLAGSPFIKHRGITSLFLMPLAIRDKVMGAIICYSKEAFIDSEFEENLTLSMAAQIALIIEKIELDQKLGKFADLANIDGLTGLYNHRYFHEALDRELARSERFKHTVCLVMLDVDHFKRYNDTYGHQAGDLALKRIAMIIKENIRPYDLAARYGGEEIALILPYTTRANALSLTERLRKKIAESLFDKEKEEFGITVSTGLAIYPTNARIKSELLKRADQALYLAKKEGRNRTCFSMTIGKKAIRFAFCPPSLKAFFKNTLIGLREVAEEVGNVKLVINPSKGDWDYKGQIEQIYRAIEEQVDAIGIFTKANVGPAVIEANRANIPVFGFNQLELEMNPKGNILSYIGYDQKEAGRKVARYLIHLLRHNGKVVILEGLQNEKDSIERKQGFMEIMLKEYPGIEVVDSQHADWERKKGFEASKVMLKKHPKIDAIFCLNDEMAIGAAEAVETMGKNGYIFTIGLDGDQAAFKSIKEGKLTATLNTNPIEMGRILLRTALRSRIKEEIIPPQIYSPINIVTMENVDQYL